MEQYFSKQAKIVDGVKQKLYFLIEGTKTPDESGGNKVTLNVMSMFEDEIPEFSKNHEFVRYATDSMAVFKVKE